MKKLGVLITSSEFGCEECHTFTCGHCNTIHVVTTGKRVEDIGGHCAVCWTLVCAGCVTRGICDPFEEKLKRVERRADTLRSYGF